MEKINLGMIIGFAGFIVFYLHFIITHWNPPYEKNDQE